MGKNNLTNKEVFNILLSLDKIITTKAKYFSKEQNFEADDAKSMIQLVSFDIFKNQYNPEKSKPITFFMNYCLPRAKTEIIRNCKLIKLPFNKTAKGFQNNFSYVSFDLTINESENCDLYNMLCSYTDNNAEKNLNEYYLKKIIRNSKLTKQEKKVINDVFYKDKSCAAVAKEMNCSDKYVYSVRKNALEKIKHTMYRKVK